VKCSTPVGTTDTEESMKNIRSVALACIVALFAAIVAQAQTFDTIFNFDGTNGESAFLGTQGLDGNLYGTTAGGGLYRGGEIFGITTAGTLVGAHSFCPDLPACANGDYPFGAPLLASDGNFYGSTSYGGTNNTGTIYKITPSGKLTTLYNSPSTVNGTSGPWVQGVNGNLYGEVGTTIYSISPAGVYTTVYNFSGIEANGLVLGPNGNLFGTTSYGGRFGNGMFFMLTPTGKLTAIYNFRTSDLFSPSKLVLASNGNFYGTSFYGGANGGGTVFELTPTGQFRVLYTFCSQANCADGAVPSFGVVQGTDGNLYGITTMGGTGGAAFCPLYCGTIFQITTSGVLTTLYNFCSQDQCADGLEPQYPLMQATDGNFYGATFQGGTSGPTGYGTIYRLSMGLAPFVRTNPTFGNPGRTIGILGNNLTGATAVSFNGTPATFTVVSDTFIKATVPMGATSGTIQVTTPSGTLDSNVSFQVLP